MLKKKKLILLTPKGEIVTIYNLAGGLANWTPKKATLDAGGSGILDIVCAGDSITEGYQTGGTLATFRANAFKWKLSTYFNTIYDDCGEGFFPIRYPATGTPGIRETGTWVESGYNFNNCSKYTETSGATLAFTFNGTGCKIWVVKGSGYSNIDVSIDGGVATNYDLTAASLTYPVIIQIAEGLTNTSHTVTITNKDNKRFHFSGYMEEKGSRGIRVHMGGHVGNKASNFGSPRQYVRDYYTDLAPDLVIYNIGVNDHGAGVVAPSTFKNYVNVFVEHLKSIGADVIIGTDGCDDRIRTYPWADFTDSLMEVALDNNCVFVNTDKQWGGINNARNNGYQPPIPSTDPHWTPLGHLQHNGVLAKII